MKVRQYGDYQVKKRSVRPHWSMPHGAEYEVYYKQEEVANFITLREAREYIKQQQGELR